MESIHKSKAEKAREKTLSDQFEAKRARTRLAGKGNWLAGRNVLLRAHRRKFQLQQPLFLQHNLHSEATKKSKK
ncbi:hypothetical protein HanPSC8_Chr09g0401591 [Helianthus annuus]|nr:hypothetical protein HanPSC8_Chr09g0401591 [Helianthus annuus]